MEELEGKLVGVDVEKIMRKVSKLGKPVELVLQEDRVFEMGRRTVRVRKEGRRCVLTHKGELKRKGPLKSREELEFEVANPDGAIQFLRVMGIDTSRPLLRKKKLFRFSIDGAKCELVFIESLPPTLEIEGSEQAIRAACKALQLRFEDLQPISWSDVQPI